MVDIDLRGPEGNAFALLAIVTNVARHAGLGKQTTDVITARMQAGTHETLLDVMDDEFPCVFRFLGDPRAGAALRPVHFRPT